MKNLMLTLLLVPMFGMNAQIPEQPPATTPGPVSTQPVEQFGAHRARLAETATETILPNVEDTPAAGEFPRVFGQVQSRNIAIEEHLAPR